MKLWNYKTADHDFKGVLAAAILSIIEIVSLIFLFFSKVPTNSSIALIGLLILTLALLAKYLHDYTRSTTIEEKVHWELRSKHLSPLYGQYASAVYNSDDSISSICFNGHYFFWDGQPRVYSIQTTIITPNIHLFGVIFENPEKQDNIFFLVEKHSPGNQTINTYYQSKKRSLHGYRVHVQS